MFYRGLFCGNKKYGSKKKMVQVAEHYGRGVTTFLKNLVITSLPKLHEKFCQHPGAPDMFGCV